MRRLFFSVICCSSLSIHAVTDFSLCADFIDKTNQNSEKTGLVLPFKINSQGKIEDLSKIIGGYKIDSDEKSRSYSLNSNGIEMLKIVILKDDSGDFENMRIESVMRNPQGVLSKNISTIEFDVNNGKCFPAYAYRDVNAGNGKTLKATLFNSGLCKKIQDFLNNNKSITQCLDSISKENKEMVKIFEENGYYTDNLRKEYLPYTALLERTSYSVEQKIISGDSPSFDYLSKGNEEVNRRVMGMTGGSPVISGYMILNDCYEKGLKSVISDGKIWNNPEVMPSSIKASVKQQ